MTEPHPWIPRAEAAPVALVSSSQQIRDEVARAAAAAGMELVHAPTSTEAQRLNPAVLVLDAENAGRRPPSGTDVVLVGLHGEEAPLWREAARQGAARVAVLPDAAPWLVEYLGRQGTMAPGGHVLGVAGSVGGAGASTLGCWLAAHAVAAGHRTLLVDGNFGGGGLELATASEAVPGARWEDLAEVRGSLNPDQFAAAIPPVDGFSLLSSAAHRAQHGAAPPAESLHSVMEAAARAFSLTVVDLPRSAPGNQPLLPFCDTVLLLVPGRLRGIAAARAHCAQFPAVPVGAVVRGPLPPDLDSVRVAEAAGCSLAGYLPQLRGIADAERNGRLLDAGRARPVRRLARAVLAALPVPAAGLAA
jgi:secretion/DNA translocation related CpaE-like protein